MLQPIQSTKYSNYYKIPPAAAGIAYAPWRAGASRFWGRRATIDFLIQLGWWWDFSWNPYEKYALTTIYVGDVSPEGGASQKRDPVTDHSTHKSGHDVDIFFVRNDGKAEKTSCLDKDKATYDLDQNIRLAKLMIEIAGRLGLTIGFFYGNDPRVRAEVPRLTAHTNHEDHFHINLVAPSELPKK